MRINFTARHFKAQKSLQQFAVQEVKKLEKFYERIVWCDIILSYEKTPQNLKIAEIHIHVHRMTLSAREKAEDFFKAIDEALRKLGRQLKKYKAKFQETKYRASKKRKVALAA